MDAVKKITLKILAAIFYPQVLIFPRDKYPNLYEYRDGEWRFKNREALRAGARRVGRSWPIRASICTRKWLSEYWMLPLAFSVLAAIPAYGFLDYLNSKMTKLCVSDRQHKIVYRPENLFEATFTYGNGREVTYRKFNPEDPYRTATWLTENLKTTTHAEDQALDRLYPAGHAWGAKQCVDF